MKCIVRIPISSWAVRYFLSQNRHKLAPDGKTIHHTAKDMIGKIVTGYMRKTAFEQWYMAMPEGPHLRIGLPEAYYRFGLTREDLENLSDILEQIAKKDICYKVAITASLPGVSRAAAIREVFRMEGITDEEYDQGHFRRYFDRYCQDSLGKPFPDFRKEITRALKEIYDPLMVDKALA